MHRYEVWHREDARYPPAFHDLPDAPERVWAEGKAEVLDRTAIAVVGTRRPTPYGVRVARQIGEALAGTGACVVSGMAAGIDAAAHEAALDAGGRTCAVLGTGVDMVYPVINTRLRHRIADAGLLLSEYAPGTRAAPWTFPKRNRLIAALTRATVVVEAGAKSGALITATWATNLGRAVAAVPGQINTVQSEGSNALLRDGAIVLAAVADAVMLIGARVTTTAAPPELSGAQAKVWDVLGEGSADVDTLSVKAHLTVAECFSAITQLELAGLVTSDLLGEVHRR